MNLWIVNFAKVQLAPTVQFTFERFKTLFFLDFDNLCILQHSSKQPESSLMDRWLGRSIIRASSRACAAAGNRKSVLRRFRSQSCLYKLTLIDLWHKSPRKILESSSRVIEDADVYFDASASRLIECVNGPDGKALACWMPNAAEKLLKRCCNTNKYY